MPTAALTEVEFPLRGPGYLEMSRLDEALRSAAKLHLTDNITVYENGAPLPAPRLTALRISLPSEKSFASFEGAYANLRGPRLADNLDLVWNQQFLDVLLEYPVRSDRSEFAMQWRVDRFGRKVTTALRFLPPGGETRAFEFHGDPGLLRLDRARLAARRHETQRRGNLAPEPVDAAMDGKSERSERTGYSNSTSRNCWFQKGRDHRRVAARANAHSAPSNDANDLSDGSEIRSATIRGVGSGASVLVDRDVVGQIELRRAAQRFIEP